nr:MAG TPA: hypothetical protein [Caudoviricetes sp.]
MKKLYFVSTNGYDMLISDDGETRRVLTDNNAVLLCDVKKPEEYLQNIVEDDSSWEEYNETVEELTADAETEILAEIEKEL